MVTPIVCCAGGPAALNRPKSREGRPEFVVVAMQACDMSSSTITQRHKRIHWMSYNAKDTQEEGSFVYRDAPTSRIALLIASSQASRNVPNQSLVSNWLYEFALFSFTVHQPHLRFAIHIHVDLSLHDVAGPVRPLFRPIHTSTMPFFTEDEVAEHSTLSLSLTSTMSSKRYRYMSHLR
jgi:hypothetical protein